MQTMQLSDYYRLMSKYEFCDPSDNSGDDFSKELVKYVKESGIELSSKIIDVGCGSGFVLRGLMQAGYTDLTGLELSKANCDFLMKEYGIKAVCGGVGDDIEELYSNGYDLVILKGVLEHLIPLNESMKFCVDLLSRNGKLLIACPDIAAFPYFDDCYQQFSVEHINYFDTSSITRLCMNHGLKLVNQKEVGYYRKGKRSECTMWLLEPGEESRQIVMPSLPQLNLYMDQSEKRLEKIKRNLSLYNISEGVILWGGGTFSSTLFQFGVISKDLIKCVVDSNKNYHGKGAYGHFVQPPEVLRNKKRLPILVASQSAFLSIQEQIREMNLDNTVINVFL